MKINDPTRPLSASRATGAARAVNRVGSATAADSPAPVADVSPNGALLGIPAAELTPRVRDTIITLMHEVELLREELDRTKLRLTELEKLADTDSLSPVANRRAFVRELSKAMSYAERYSVPTSILFFDVNGLKKINDTLGHAAGDQVLIHVAETLRANVRGSDIIGRLGGDEYGLILTHANEEQALAKSQFLSERISERPVEFQGHQITAAAAVGVYCIGPGETPTDVLSRADERMYHHKRALKAQRAD
jgi:diguanylate cyclase (GGDEF)-like protein